MPNPPSGGYFISFLDRGGRKSVAAINELGYAVALVVESFYWLLLGPFKQQPVRPSSVAERMMEVGLRAAPIVFMLSFAVGVMLAIQGIHTLRVFGAEGQVVLGIAISVTREFGPLITAILVAGRSGAALAARIGTMQVNQEVDALRVMGINPVRYLVSPVLAAMLVMVPVLTAFSIFSALLGGAIFCRLQLDLSYYGFWQQTIIYVAAGDLYQGLFKSVVFAVLIALIGAANGFLVRGGAEGVGAATTRAVVISISAIVLADMVFTYFLNRAGV
ncbi:MAG: ABC transporter permease [Pseudomonadota bacterium]